MVGERDPAAFRRMNAPNPLVATLREDTYESRRRTRALKSMRRRDNPLGSLIHFTAAGDRLRHELERIAKESADPGELAQLAMSRHITVTGLVIDNPNTAISVLKELAMTGGSKRHSKYEKKLIMASAAEKLHETYPILEYMELKKLRRTQLEKSHNRGGYARPMSFEEEYGETPEQAAKEEAHAAALAEEQSEAHAESQNSQTI